MNLLPTLLTNTTGPRARSALAKSLTVSLAVAVSLALTGCGPSDDASKDTSTAANEVATASQPSAKSAAEAPAVFVFGDTTFNAENEEPDVNPRNGYAGWAALRYGVGETLFRYDEHMRPQPWLAERFENVDPLTWRIELKENVRFSNGRAVDAAAVKASLEALVKEHARARGDLRIAAIDADGLTLTIRTEVPRPTLVNYLSDPYGAVVDVAAGVKDGIVVGTGPYRAVKVATNDSIELVRNDNYWDETRPGYDRVRVLTISDGDTLTMALQSGEIDAAYGLPYASHVLFKKGGFVSTSTATSRTFFLHMNYKSPIASDPAVRRAVAMAVDKERFASVLLQGNGVPATGPFPADFAFGGKAVSSRTFDLKAAAEVLESAGWRDANGDGVREKDGKPLVLRWLTYPSRQELPLLAEMVQADLKSIGVKVDVNSTADHNALRRRPETWDVYASAMVTAPTGDPAYFFTTHALQSSSENNGGYVNPELEALAETLSNTFDPAKREALAVEMQNRILADDAFVFAAHLKMTMVAREGVEGLKAHPTDFYEITPVVRPAEKQK